MGIDRFRYSSKDFFIDPDIGRAESLPAEAFTDEAFLQLELRTIFVTTWLLLSPQLSKSVSVRGARMPFNLLGRPLFLQRSLKREELHCFPNVCTHAWYPLVESADTSGTITCPQHGRQFDSNGKFLAHAGFENLENFPRESDHLLGFPIREWSQLCYVCLGQPRLQLDEILSEFLASIPGVRLDQLSYHPTASEIRVVEGNWKQHAWNYMDNYHIRFVHKGPGGLADAIDQSTYKTELYNLSALQWVYARNPKHGFEPNQLSPRFKNPEHPDRRVFALWWFIFPNLTLNLYPWGLSVNVYMPVPGQPDRTEFHWYQYALDEEKFKLRDAIWLNQQVDDEDIEAIALVNKGARSGYAPRGRFAPKEELGPHWFHRLVYLNAFGPNTRG